MMLGHKCDVQLASFFTAGLFPNPRSAVTGHGFTGCASPRKRAGVDGGCDPDPEFCLRTFGDTVPLNMQSTLWETFT